MSRRRENAGADEDVPPAKAAKARGNDPTSSSATQPSLLDPQLAAALHTGREAFVAPSEDSDEPLQRAQVREALLLARGNPNLRVFGMDGTGCTLDASSARALGDMAVVALKFVGLSFADEAAVDAFTTAIGANRYLQTLAAFETDADGSWRPFDPAHSAFVAAVRRHRLEHELAPLAIEQVGVGENDADANDAGEDDAGEDVADEDDADEDEADEDDEGGESEEDGQDFVECDGRLGRGRNAVTCRRRLIGDDLVFVSSFGLDYCTECHARLGREGLRRTTAALRIEEEQRS